MNAETAIAKTKIITAKARIISRSQLSFSCCFDVWIGVWEVGSAVGVDDEGGWEVVGVFDGVLLPAATTVTDEL